jgi:predicted secreted protein
MKKVLYSLLFFSTILLFGCSKNQEQNTVTIELDANATTGYSWVYTITPDNVIREISNEYILNKNEEKMPGMGGKHDPIKNNV